MYCNILDTKNDISVLNLQRTYRKRFLISKGCRFFSVGVNDVACFIYEDRTTYALMFNGNKHILDMSLHKIEEELDPSLFFRTNRMSIINISAFNYFEYYLHGKLVVKLKTNVPVKILVSRCKAVAFKEWLGK